MAIRGAERRATLEKCIAGKIGQKMYDKLSKTQRYYFKAILDGFNT